MEFPKGRGIFYGDHIIYLTIIKDTPVFIHAVTCHASSGEYKLIGDKVKTKNAVYSFDFDSAGGEESGQPFGTLALGENGMIMLRDMATAKSLEVEFNGIRIDQPYKPEFTEAFGFFENQQEMFKAFADLYDDGCRNITASDLLQAATDAITIEAIEE